MTNRRNKLLTRLLRTVKGEEEATLMKLTIERICADMCEYYSKFYANEGPGAMIYVPDAEDEKKTMFYLNLNEMMAALDDFNNRSMDGPADVMQKAITRAEALSPEKESLFIIQDREKMTLILYKHDNDGVNLIQM